MCRGFAYINIAAEYGLNFNKPAPVTNTVLIYASSPYPCLHSKFARIKMTVYCHLCYKATDLPAEGHASKLLATIMTTPSTYQCLDSECWARSLRDAGDDVNRIDRLERLLEQTKQTSRAQNARLQAGNAPKSLDDARERVLGLRNELIRERFEPA